MKTKPLSYCCLGLVSVAIAGVVAGCSTSETPTATPSPAVTNASLVVAPSSPEAAPAMISDIQQDPVWLQLLNDPSEISAHKGMGVRIGEKIRTQGLALAQLDFKNGAGLRIGGDSVLTLQPNNRLALSAGEMITWVQPGQKVPVEISTPAAIAKIQSNTVSIRIPKQPQEEIEFVAWEGPVTLQLPNQSGEIVLQAGETVRIKPNEIDTAEVRRQVRRLTPIEWDQRRFQNRLFNNFVKPLPTLQAIENAAPTRDSILSSATLAQTRLQPTPPQQANSNRPARPFPKVLNPSVSSRVATSRQTTRATPELASTSRPARPQTGAPNPRIDNNIPIFSPARSALPEAASSKRPNRSWSTLPNPAVLNSTPSPTASPTASPTQEATPEATSPIRPPRPQTREDNPSGDTTASPTQEATPEATSPIRPPRPQTREDNPSGDTTASPTQEATPEATSPIRPPRPQTREDNPSGDTIEPTPSPTNSTPQKTTPEAASTSSPAPQELENNNNDTTDIQDRELDRKASREENGSTPNPSPNQEATPEEANTSRPTRRFRQQGTSTRPTSREIDDAND